MAVMATLEFWSEVGGQSHLDFMAWWWKFGLSLGMAAAVVKLTAVSARPGGLASRAAALWLLVIGLILFTGGLVTYYYHAHEPLDESDEDPALRAGRSALLLRPPDLS